MSQTEGKGFARARVLGDGSGRVSVLERPVGFWRCWCCAGHVSSKEVFCCIRIADVLWLVCPVMLYWISRVWMLAYRNQMDDDPVVFLRSGSQKLSMAHHRGHSLLRQ